MEINESGFFILDEDELEPWEREGLLLCDPDEDEDEEPAPRRKEEPDPWAMYTFCEESDYI